MSVHPDFACSACGGAWDREGNCPCTRAARERIERILAAAAARASA